MSANTRLTAVLGISLIAVAALCLHAYSFLPYFADDSLISLQYVKRLLDGKGLTWTEGEYVEGYSNLLWVLLVAVFGTALSDLVLAARVAGTVCMSGALLVLIRTASRIRPESLLAPAVAAFFFVLSGPVAVWSIGGLEQPLVALLLAGAVAEVLGFLSGQRASAGRAGALFALLALSRPDGALFGIVTAAFLLRLKIPEGRRWAFTIAAVTLSAAGAHELFRLWYYGEFIPNTARVKLLTSLHYISYGAKYLLRGFGLHAPLLAAGLCAVWVAIRHRFARAEIGYLAALIISWSGYLLFIGGDVIPPSRHFVVTVLLLALLSAYLCAWLKQQPAVSARRDALILAPFALVLAVWLQLIDIENRDTRRNDMFLSDGEVSSALLRRVFGSRDPLLAADQAGWPAFFTGFRGIDMLGLTDSYLAKHPPAELGSGWMGHELGDGRYILSRRPDLVLFCSMPGAPTGCWKSGVELGELPEFAREYRLITVRTDSPRPFSVTLWVRKEGERVGIQRSTDRIEIPAFHFVNSDGAPLEVGGTGASTAGEAGAMLQLELPAGRWSIESAGTVKLTASVGGETREGSAPLEILTVSASDELTIKIAPGQSLGDLTLRQISQ